jgi:predicted hydrocarbon binding protein
MKWHSRMDMTRNAICRLDEEAHEKIEKSMLIETYWMAIRALVDMIGSEGTISEVRPHFRNGGHAFALNMIKMFEIDGNDIEAIDEVTALYETIFDILSNESEHTTDRIERIGTSCPFTGAPWEACVLGHEIMYQSICERINPDFTCRFTQMMSNGDPTCSWVIEKKKK